MARPKVMNAAFGEFQQEVMARFNRLLDEDPKWLPTEAQSRVLKLLAETQAILHKGAVDENAKLPNKRQRDEALALLEGRLPPREEPEADVGADA